MPEIPNVQIGAEYTEIDRARDFIAVFSGSSTKEQGLRVYAQIRAFCSPVSSPGTADSPGMLAFNEGRRWVLQQIDQACVPRQKLPDVERKPDAD